MMKYAFPEGFFWGASISSYQVEGGNIASDWYSWESEKGLISSGQACRHYQYYHDDFSSAASLGHNALRMSLEWARLCPEPGSIDCRVREHYRDQVRDLKQLGLEPVVTLHHFTNPLWFAQKGGWAKTGNIDHFLRYVSEAAEMLLAENVRYFIIINEPLVYLYKGFIEGAWPPGESSLRLARRVLNNMVTAYCLAYQELKARAGTRPVFISIAKNMVWFSPCRKYDLGQNSLFAGLRSRLFNYSLLDTLCGKNVLDFIGVNYYYRQYVKAGFGLLGRECREAHHPEQKNFLGWNVSAPGFLHVLVSLKRYSRPLLITENGTAEKDPAMYEPFLTGHIRALASAMAAGVDCRGYLWWALIDNFEWDQGFGPRFGLIDIDYQSFSRTIKPFARKYSQIIRENAVII